MFFNFSLNKELDYSGTFELPDPLVTLGGHFRYLPDSLPKIDLYIPNWQDRNFQELMYLESGVEYSFIHGFIGNNIAFNGINGVTQSKNLGDKGRIFTIVFQSVFLGQYLTPETKIQSTYICFDILNEFFQNETTKDKTIIGSNNLDIKINDDLTIGLIETSSLRSIRGSEFTNTLCFGPEEGDIETAIKTLIDERIAQNGDFLIRQNTGRHYAINLKKHLTTPSTLFNDYIKDIQTISHLLTVLTHTPVGPDFSSVAFPSPTEDFTLRNDWIISYNINRDTIDAFKKEYSSLSSPINHENIKQHLRTIFIKTFNHYDSLKDFFELLSLNMIDNSPPIFKFTRTADAIKLIAKNIKGRKGQYQDTLEKYCFEHLQEILFPMFMASDFKTLGVNIYNVRGFIVHKNDQHELFNNVQQFPSFYKCLELPIYAYIHDMIGVPFELASEFQQHWVKRYKDIRLVRF